MLPANRPVRAVLRDGTVVTGRRLNEDTFTVQLIDSNERLVSLDRAAIREYTVGSRADDAVVCRRLQRRRARRSRRVSTLVERAKLMRATATAAALIAAAVGAASAHGASHVRAAAECRCRAAQLAHVLRHVCEPTAHGADADSAEQRRRARAQVGVSGTVARELRDDAARRRRRHVPDGGAEHGGRRRRAHGQAVLALSVQSVGRRAAVLRPRESRSRDARQHACSWRRSIRS